MPTMAGSTHFTRFRSPIITIPTGWAFAALRVINEDRVAPGMGFGTHGHRNMEIVTFVLAGRSSIATAWETARSFGPATCSG